MHVIKRVYTEAEVTYLQNLRDHVQKDCVFGISRLLCDFLMFVAESLAHLSASLAPHLP